MTAFRPFLQRAASGAVLSREEMREAMDLLLSGEAGEIEAAGFLMAIRARGETIEEIAAAAEAMRKKAKKVEAPEGVIDTCGTGGDGADTFNISTAAALVAAGAGAKVAKHGNRAMSSKSGSSEVLEALGVRLSAEPKVIAREIREAGVGFMFAAYHHGAVAHVAGVRRALGVRTLFNILGPLSNPAGARRQLMGVFSRDLVEPIAGALAALGAERAWVVHGSDGLDELTTTGPTFVAEVANGQSRVFTVTPQEAGLPLAAPGALRGGDPSENADAIRSVLKGRPSAFRDVVILNAAAALIVSGIAESLADGAALAAKSIDDGAAAAALARLAAISHEAE